MTLAVQLHQQLALLNGIAFTDVDLFDFGGDARRDFDIGHRLDLARSGDRPADIPPLDFGGGDIDDFTPALTEIDEDHGGDDDEGGQSDDDFKFVGH